MKTKSVFFLIVFANSLLSSVAQILPTFGNSRSGTSGMQFLKVWPDARSGALGGAVTAIVNDPSAAYWNPAGLVKGDTGKFKYLPPDILQIPINIGFRQYLIGANMPNWELALHTTTMAV